MRRILFSFSLLLLNIMAVVAQGDIAEKLNEDAEYYLSERLYEKAYSCYNKLISIDKSNELYYKLKKGVAATHIPSRKEEAITILEGVKSTDSSHYSMFLYLGEAYHHNYKFDQAIVYLQRFLSQNPKAKDRKEAELALLQAKNGKEIVGNKIEVEITNIGAPINSEDAEYVPIISADESVLIYTYVGKKSTGGLMDADFKKDPQGDYYEDIFISQRANEHWEEPQSIGSNINTKHNDAAIAISADGQDLYTFYSTEKDGGDIYVCHLIGDKWSLPEKLGSTINTKSWEGSCSISGDNKFLYFASERPGGLGGKDIYVSEKKANGTWGPAENLGPTVNTPYDDDSPFIHTDGITLYFSSQGHNSIGGYDIMYCIKKGEEWTPPKNIGYPINTTDDDIYYVLTAKGDKGYFSSTRTGYNEKGSVDIYQVKPGVFGDRPVVAMLKGIVYGNDVPIQAEIKVIKLSTGEVIGPFNSNKKTGHYLVALQHGEQYNVQVDASGYPLYQEDLNVSAIKQFIEIHKDFHLAKNGYKDPHVDTLKRMNDLVGVLDTITNISYHHTPKDTAPYVVIGKNPLDTIKHVTVINNPPKDTTKIVVINNPPKDTTKIVVINNPPKDTTQNVVVVNTDPCKDFKTLNFAELKRKSLNDPRVYKKLLEIGNKICANGMKFKVQIAAYKHPENYKWKHLAEFGQPDALKLGDGITRLTQGNFISILDAEAQRQKAIAKGQTDAWITGVIDGKRYTLEELIMVDFYNKNIAAYEKNYKELEEILALSDDIKGAPSSSAIINFGTK
jgi:tetratricopeptide (TPR) repeat protein